MEELLANGAQHQVCGQRADYGAQAKAMTASTAPQQT